MASRSTSYKPTRTFWRGSVANTLRYWRRQRGLTLAQVATALGVSTDAAGKWERGEAELTVKRVPPLAHLLDIPPCVLLGAACTGVALDCAAAHALSRPTSPDNERPLDDSGRSRRVS